MNQPPEPDPEEEIEKYIHSVLRRADQIPRKYITSDLREHIDVLRVTADVQDYHLAEIVELGISEVEAELSQIGFRIPTQIPEVGNEDIHFINEAMSGEPFPVNFHDVGNVLVTGKVGSGG